LKKIRLHLHLISSLPQLFSWGQSPPFRSRTREKNQQILSSVFGYQIGQPLVNSVARGTMGYGNSLIVRGKTQGLASHPLLEKEPAFVKRLYRPQQNQTISAEHMISRGRSLYAIGGYGSSLSHLINASTAYQSYQNPQEDMSSSLKRTLFFSSASSGLDFVDNSLFFVGSHQAANLQNSRNLMLSRSFLSASHGLNSLQSVFGVVAGGFRIKGELEDAKNQGRPCATQR
jgi:hypothetical protein